MAVDINITGEFKSNGVSAQPSLVSGSNIKTINGTSILGSGDLVISGGVTSVTGTAPIASSGGATPAISMPAATTSVDGYLTSTNFNTFNNKQPTLVSGTNIKTVNGTTLLGSGNLTVSATPSGGANEVQYSSGTAFAASSAFVYTASGFGFLGVGITTPLARVHIKGRGTNPNTFGLLVENLTGFISLQCDDNHSVYNYGRGSVATNTAFGLLALVKTGIAGTTGGFNTAFGASACRFNDTGTNNTGIGHGALNGNGSGSFNTAIGATALASGSSNTVIGANATASTFSASVVLGREATATASNQFVVGSTSYNAGTVAAEVNASANVWNVVINGVARKILLA
jgi:hypothetical protein